MRIFRVHIILVFIAAFSNAFPVEKGSKLKLAGVAYRGGAYRGFLSYVKEQNKENQKNWSEIKKYKII